MTYDIKLITNEDNRLRFITFKPNFPMLKLKSMAVVLLGLSSLSLSAQTIDGIYRGHEKYGLKADDGHYILPKIYDRIVLIPEENPHFVVWQNGYFGVTDKNGKFIIPINYEAANNNDDFLSTDGDVAYFPDKTVFPWRNKAGKVGLFQDYKIVVPFEYDEIAVAQSPEDDGTGAYPSFIADVLLEKGGKVYRMDWKTKKIDSKTIGTSLLGIDYVGFIYVQNGSQIDIYKNQQKIAPTFKINDRNANCLIHDNGKYGVIKANAEILIPLMYDKIDDMLRNGNWIVANNGKWGVVSDKNEVIIPLKYDAIAYIYNLPYYSVKKGEFYAIFDDKNKPITDFEYLDVSPYFHTEYKDDGSTVESFNVTAKDGKTYSLSFDGKVRYEIPY